MGVLTAVQEAKVATYLAAWQQADTPKKRAWLIHQAAERDETVLCDVALLRSTYPHGRPTPAPALTSTRCPSCNSPQPHLHPSGGRPCADRFHLTVTEKNTPEHVAKTQALLINLTRSTADA